MLEIDIWRVAKMLVDEHGDAAAFAASSRADALLDKGDIDGQRVWLRVLSAVRVLQNTDRPPGTPEH